MAIVAGVDIGNSTTEIVIAEASTPLIWERRATRGQKGSPSSVRAAAALLANIESQAGIKVDRVQVAPWHPVLTQVKTIHEPAPDTGHIQLINCAQHSVAGDACAVGAPWDISSMPDESIELVAIVTRGSGYRKAAQHINSVIERGVSVTGVIVADDEAVLISSRLNSNIPVVDRADCSAALAADRLFVEVRPAGQCVKNAADVWALQSAFETNGRHEESFNLIARWVRDSGAVIIGLFDQKMDKPQVSSTSSVVSNAGETLELFDAVSELGNRPVGSIRTLNLEKTIPTHDVWALDIDRVMLECGVRVSEHTRTLALASLSAENDVSQQHLHDLFPVQVTMVGSESRAALLGAHSTPGLPNDVIVLDIGGGTIDLVCQDHGICAAGAGELLSAAVAHVLDIPHGAADWIKRGPAQRVESARVRLSENGARDFVGDNDLTTPANATGMLVAPGPAGLLAFGRNLQPAEWRIMRQSLKMDVIAKNVSRILTTYQKQAAVDAAFNIVIVGGPAADDELLPVLGRLPQVSGFGRANVAACLGHRYAVAYGLTQL